MTPEAPFLWVRIGPFNRSLGRVKLNFNFINPLPTPRRPTLIVPFLTPTPLLTTQHLQLHKRIHIVLKPFDSSRAIITSQLPGPPLELRLELPIQNVHGRVPLLLLSLRGRLNFGIALLFSNVRIDVLLLLELLQPVGTAHSLYLVL